MRWYLLGQQRVFEGVFGKVVEAEAKLVAVLPEALVQVAADRWADSRGKDKTGQTGLTGFLFQLSRGGKLKIETLFVDDHRVRGFDPELQQ